MDVELAIAEKGENCSVGDSTPKTVSQIKKNKVGVWEAFKDGC